MKRRWLCFSWEQVFDQYMKLMSIRRVKYLIRLIFLEAINLRVLGDSS
jgi:hypothetical protein